MDLGIKHGKTEFVESESENEGKESGTELQKQSGLDPEEPKVLDT